MTEKSNKNLHFTDFLSYNIDEKNRTWLFLGVQKSMKRRTLHYVGLLLVLNMVLALFLPNHLNIVKAEGESNDTTTNETSNLGLFIVEKTWSNDTDENKNPIVDDNNKRIRPTSINIRIEGSNGTDFTSQLLEDEGWKKFFKLPYNNGETEITYTVYETDTLDKYTSNATATSKLTISKVESGRNSNTFNVEKIQDFSKVPQPTVSINPNLDLSNAIKSYPSGASYLFVEDTVTYTDAQNKQKVDEVDSVIFYNGTLQGPEAGSTNKYHDNSIPGPIVLEWQDSDTFHPATDIYGNTYPVRVTISNIVVRALKDLNKKVAIVAYKDRLMMQAYVGEFTDNSIKDNLVGVKADVKVEVVGVQPNNYTMSLFDDIDVPDYIDYYSDKETLDNNNYFGLEYPFAESIQLKGAISSDVYINKEKTYLIYDENRKFSSINNPNDSTYDNHYTTMLYLAPAEEYSFTWTGSDCGSSLLNYVYLPDLDSITNKIENVSGLYKVRYFFQDDYGQYDFEKPDKEDKLVMIKPGSEISVDQNAKKNPTEVIPTKTNYELDTTQTKVTEKKTVTTANGADNPQILNVYFKKKCIVVYHDNINEDISIGTLWDPADQTTDEGLYFNSNTPAFDGDVTTANPGYKFTGWSIVDPADRSETELPGGNVLQKVDRVETHYLAHWEALPNQYIVHYFYEVDGKYPSKDNPDYISSVRDVYNGEKVYTDSHVEIEPSDLIPNPEKGSYVLNDAMNGEWKGTVKANGLILRVYFKHKSERIPYEPPVTGIH